MHVANWFAVSTFSPFLLAKFYILNVLEKITILKILWLGERKFKKGDILLFQIYADVRYHCIDVLYCQPFALYKSWLHEISKLFNILIALSS